MGKCVLRNYDSNGNLISLECFKCHEIKAVSEFHKCKSKKDGVNTMCKECNKQYYRENDGKERERQKKSIRVYDSDGNLISLECCKCHKVKVVSEFSKHKNKKDGVDTICKDCRKEYYKQNTDKIKEYNAEYYKQNADKIKEQNAEYYKQNADKKKEYQSEYNKQNADKIKEKNAEYYKQNTDKIKEYNAEYYKQNADKIAEYRKQNADKIKEYDKERYDSKVKQALAEIKAYVEIDPQKYDYNPNEEIYGIIYLVHNVKSDKYYVGQTINSFDIRYQSGWLYTHSYKDTVKADLELYGEDSFEYVKIFKVAHTQQDLDKLEAYYIDYFNSYDNGYNETRGNIFTERK